MDHLIPNGPGGFTVIQWSDEPVKSTALVVICNWDKHVWLNQWLICGRCFVRMKSLAVAVIPWTELAVVPDPPGGYVDLNIHEGEYIEPLRIHQHDWTKLPDALFFSVDPASADA